jgi:DNA-binding NarL/FixJ family response regulator
MLEADGMVVVGEATDGIEAVKLAKELEPDVVVMDLKMPNYSGIEATRRIVAGRPEVQVVILTVSTADKDVLDALEAGASSYLLKDIKADELVGGIRQAASGNAVLSRDIAQALMARVRSEAAARENKVKAPLAAEAPSLTAREMEVLKLIALGADNAAIGRELSISPHTVKQYVTNIFEKLGVRSRVQAAVHAVRSGLV